jgi:hypothetical protein
MGETNGWLSTLSRKVRFIAGHIIVCTLVDGHVWMALDKGLLGSTNDRFVLEQSGDWEWDTGGYPEYPSISSRNGHYRPSEKHAEIWPVVRWYSEGRGTARVGMTKYEVGLTYVFTTIYRLFGLGIIIAMATMPA